MNTPQTNKMPKRRIEHRTVVTITGDYVKEQQCGKCSGWKTLDHYYTSKVNRLGYQGECMECRRIYAERHNRTH